MKVKYWKPNVFNEFWGRGSLQFAIILHSINRNVF